jgi:hypothetical protein
VLLEGLDIQDEEFEDWLRLERSHWDTWFERLRYDGFEPVSNVRVARTATRAFPGRCLEVGRALAC